MIRGKRAAKVLSKSDQKYLTEEKINSYADLQSSLNFIAKRRLDDFPLFCKYKSIGIKLGMRGEMTKNRKLNLRKPR